MVRLVEKIKNIFSGKFVYKPKCGVKKEESKSQQEEPKAEEKPEEQKQQSST